MEDMGWNVLSQAKGKYLKRSWNARLVGIIKEKLNGLCSWSTKREKDSGGNEMRERARYQIMQGLEVMVRSLDLILSIMKLLGHPAQSVIHIAALPVPAVIG